MLGILHLLPNPLSLLFLLSVLQADLHGLGPLAHLPSDFSWIRTAGSIVDIRQRRECVGEFISLPIRFPWAGNMPLLKAMAPPRQLSPSSSVSGFQE